MTTKSLLDDANSHLTPEVVGTEQVEIVCPLTGEIIEESDLDGLAAMYLRLMDKRDQINAVMAALKQSVAKRCIGEQKTRHVMGEQFVWHVTEPDESWSQPMLKKAWADFPGLRGALRIETVAVDKTQYKKLQNTSGTPEVELFKSALQAANLGKTQNPSVKVERLVKSGP